MTTAEKVLLTGSSMLTAATGAVYGIMKYLMVSSDPYAVINHPWQPFFLKLHIVVSPVMVFAIGLVFRIHVLDRWKSGSPRRRRSGAILSALLLPMAASGYLIQVFTGGMLLHSAAVIHAATGTAFLIGLLLHRRLLGLLFPAPPRGSLEAGLEGRRKPLCRDRSST